mgnify:FL=1
MVRVLVVFLAIDEVEMFCPSDTCEELPLDHVLHQVISGVGTPEATHVRVIEFDCTTTWLTGAAMISGITKEVSQSSYNKTNS